jgi:hypothetical protein
MRKNTVNVATAIILFFALTLGVSAQSAPIPNPVLSFLKQEHSAASGTAMIRYKFFVSNASSFPDELFAPAPNLAPCGKNKNASRTWVEVFDQSGRRLNGFCAIKSNSGLSDLWFALPDDVVPPSWVYIELLDRQTGNKYKSNLAETTN